MMKLSERMEAVAALVTQGGVLADVGTDHAHLPIALVERGRIARAIAMDIRRGPLLHARENIDRCGLGGRIETRLCDGVAALEPGEADTIVIAGMGGELVVHILSGGGEVCRRAGELILQPQSQIDRVRRYLRREGYSIAAENMIWEDGKYYPMMRAVPGGRAGTAVEEESGLLSGKTAGQGCGRVQQEGESGRETDGADITRPEREAGQGTDGRKPEKEAGRGADGRKLGQEAGREADVGRLGQEAGRGTDGRKPEKEDGREADGRKPGEEAGCGADGGRLGEKAGRGTDGRKPGEEAGRRADGGRLGEKAGRGTDGRKPGQEAGRGSCGRKPEEDAGYEADGRRPGKDAGQESDRTQLEDLYGPILLREHHPVLAEFLRQQQRQLCSVQEQLARTQPTDRVLRRREEVARELWLCQEALQYCLGEGR